MRFLAFMLIPIVLASCSDSPGSKALPNRVDSQIPQKSNWVPGEYLPSENFANQCESPRLNTDYQDLIGTYKDENNWIRSWSHETYLWYNELPDIDPSSIQDAEEYFNQMMQYSFTKAVE